MNIQFQNCYLIEYAVSMQYIFFEVKFRKIIYSRDIIFDKDDHKICSSENVIKIHAENKNQQRNDFSTQQEKISITVQIN